MSRNLVVDRLSIGSLEDDPFYSAPTSRVGSGHVSIINSHDKLGKKESIRIQPSEPLVMMCQPTDIPTNPTSTLESSDLQCAAKSKCNIHFLNKQEHNPEHHDIGTTVINPQKKLKSDSSIHDDNPAANGTVPLDTLTSSPAQAIAARRWSSICLEHQESMPQYSKNSPVLIETPLGGPVSRQGVEGILGNICAYLSDKRYDDCPRSIDTVSVSNENHFPSLNFRPDDGIINDGRLKPPTSPIESYLVTTHDIATILDIVITGIRRFPDGNTDIGCQSLMFPREPLVKPNHRTKMMVLPVPTIADPATTISSVQPCFSLTAFPGSSRRHTQVAKSTFISRQSITEV
ncbi:hypothetical protein F5X99DRAFT_380191, partial [Biscogniauxia marginata]